MRPGSSPMRNLADALLDDSALKPERAGHEESAAFLLATLRRGPLGIVDALRETPLPEETNLLILVDQFEEIFRYRTQHNQNEADAFVALLLASAEQRALPIYVVLTMRSDFLGDCALFMGLPEGMNESQFLTPRLTREQRREAIEGPAAVFGGTVEASLVNRILNDMGADPDQLPLMQHALMRMWTRTTASANPSLALTLSGYEAIGGIENALSDHADEAFDEPDEEQKGIAETLFLCLSERSTCRRDTRRPVKLSEVAALAGVSPQKAISVVNVFRRPDRSFITPPATVPLTPEKVLDISHESLIRQWKRLNDWVEEDAASAETYRRLEQTAQLWEGGKAALWSTPYLENALAWQERQHPTRDWAARYGSHFDLAMEFLEESGRKRRKDEEVWKRELQERTLSLFNSHLTHASLLAKRGVEDYAQARQILSKTYELDKEIPETRRHARNLLAGFVEIMGGEPNQEYEGAWAPLFTVAVSPDGRLLAVSGEKGTLVLFEVDSGRLIKRLEGHDKTAGEFGTVMAVAFHPHGKWLASAGTDKRIILWSVPAGEKLREWEAPDKVGAMAVSPDGTQLASGGVDNAVTLWDAETGKELRTFEGHSERISEGGLAFSPTGEGLASASYDDIACVWEVSTGGSLQVLRGHIDDVHSITFSPDSKQLATSSRDQTIRLWDAKSGHSLRALSGHQNMVFSLRFLADGSTLVSASHDRTLRVWDAESGVSLRVLQGHSAGVSVGGIATHAGQLFSLRLPTNSGWPTPLWDFDFRCTPEGNCWIAVPLTREKLVLYELPYESVQNRPEDLRARYSVWDGYIRLIDMQLQLNTPRAALQTSQESLETIKRLIENDPSAFLAQRAGMVSRWKSGQAQQALKKPETALRAYQEAAAIAEELAEKEAHNPEAQIDLGNVLFSLGELLTEQKRDDEAKDVYDRLFAIDLDRTDWLFRLAKLADRLNRFEQYERDLRHVLQIDPKHVKALNSLGYALAERTDRYQEAYDLIKRALDLQPENWNYQDSMGWVLYKMGKYSGSLEYLRKAYAKIDDLISPETAAEIVAHLVEVLWVTGEKKEAKEVWEKGLKDYPEDRRLLQWNARVQE